MINRLPKGPVALAVILTLGLVIWLASGEFRQSRETMEDPFTSRTEQPARVEVASREATLFQPEVVVQGQLEPWQAITVDASVAGTVDALPVALGESASRGDVLVRLSEENRTEQLEQAKAELERAEADLSGASRLRGENLASQSEYLARKADVAAARANLRTARIALEDSSPEAPFDGTLNKQAVDVGDEVQPGEPLVELVRVDKLKATGRVSQQKAAPLEEGQPVRVILLDGRQLTGELTFIASSAHPETRSFRIEAELENPDGLRVAGSTATLRIGLAPELATRLSPAHLSLDEHGKLGVAHVDSDDEVAFSRVRLLSTDNDGAWVSGLPLRIRLITRGAGFVQPGQGVVPVPADDSGEG